ncbi:MAG: hypothetical protein AAF960_21075 [Bacteroidota bacterium]
MKTKLSTLAILCCCLLVSVFSCQKENVTPQINYPTPVVAIEQTTLQALRKEAPDYVVIKPATDNKTVTDTEMVPSGKVSHIPTPYPIGSTDCNYSGCFPLTKTYERMQETANFSCHPVERKVCCCFQGKFMCFVVQVSPTVICPEAPINTDIEIVEQKAPIVVTRN